MIGIASTLNLGGNGSDLMSLGYSTSKYKSSSGSESDPYKSVCINFMPKAGFFIIDNLAAGLNIIVSTSSEKDTGDDDKYIDNLLGIGPWVRYYFPLEKFYPFVEVNVGVGTQKSSWEYGGTLDEEKYGILIFGGGVGAAMPVTRRVSFDIMAGYSYITLEEKDQQSEETYKEIVGTIGLTIGFVVYFGQK
jgi:hypothetical protein